MALDKRWLSVFILCYINLINYMDRYTVAGKIFFDSLVMSVGSWILINPIFFYPQDINSVSKGQIISKANFEVFTCPSIESKH